MSPASWIGCFVILTVVTVVGISLLRQFDHPSFLQQIELPVQVNDVRPRGKSEHISLEGWRPSGHNNVRIQRDRTNDSCHLGPAAEIATVRNTGTGLCNWFGKTPRKPNVIDGCVYHLRGNCPRVWYRNCLFYGSGAIKRIPLDFVPLDVAPGESSTNFTKAEQETMLQSFNNCQDRVTYYLHRSFPTYHKDHMLALAMGGVSSEQHIYFVAHEMNDAYGLYALREKESAQDVKVIVDIGLNVGMYTITACKLFPRADIYAFEPHPINFRSAVQNVKEAGCDASKVHLFNRGITWDGRSIEMYMANSIGNSAYLSSWNTTSIRVPTITVDQLWSADFIGTDTVVDTMKVDCEGCEFEVIPLMVGHKHKIKTMACEVHDSHGIPDKVGVNRETVNKVIAACSKNGHWINTARR